MIQEITGPIPAFDSWFQIKLSMPILCHCCISLYDFVWQNKFHSFIHSNHMTATKWKQEFGDGIEEVRQLFFLDTLGFL